MTSDAAVVAEGLVKHVGDVVALDGIDLSMERGKVVGLLGPNGAGKTTAVRILSALSQCGWNRMNHAGFDAHSVVNVDTGQVRRIVIASTRSLRS